jgi:hypothetical protein
MMLTAERRRKNREGLLDVLGVPPDGTIVRSPLTAGQHEDVFGGPGFLEIGEELLEVDSDEMEEMTADLAVRPGLSPRSPGYGARSSTSYVEPAPENTPEGRAARERLRRRGIASEVLLGRTSAGAKGDADAGGLGVSESAAGARGAAERLSEAAERVCGCSTGDPEARGGGCGAICGMAARNLNRHGGAGGLRESTNDAGPLRDWNDNPAA